MPPDKDAADTTTEKVVADKVVDDKSDVKSTDKAVDGGDKDNANGDKGKDAKPDKVEEVDEDGDGGSLLDFADDDDEDKADDKADGDKKPDVDKDKTEDKGDKPEAKWREKLVERLTKGLDEKLSAKDYAKRKEAILNGLKRYKSEEDFKVAGFSAQERIRAGKGKPDETSSKEDIKAWREANGVPEKADAYEIPKIAGHTWTEADNPVLEGFKEAAHKADMPQAAVNQMTQWYADTLVAQQENAVAEQAAINRADKEVVADTLRAELGIPEFKPSIALMDRLLNDEKIMPEGLGSRLLGALYTGEDGKAHRLINDVHFARMLIDFAKDTYGEGAMVATDVKTNMSSRAEEIKRIMKEDPSRYAKENLGDELMEIIRNMEGSGGRRGKKAA